jgi:ADP-ribose pyrophosphatase
VKQPETILSEENIFDGKLLRVRLRQVELPDGAVARREVVLNRGAVAIVALTEAREVRLVKQWRAAAEKWMIELPAGGLEIDEDPALAAPRELMEETGDRAASWQKLPGYFASPGILNEYLHVYLATGLTPGPNNTEFDENIEVLTVPWAEAIAMIRRGDIEDAKTVAGLMQAGLHLNLL